MLDIPIQENAEESNTQNSIVTYLRSFVCEDGNNDQMEAYNFVNQFVFYQGAEARNNDDVQEAAEDSDASFDILFWVSQQNGNVEEYINDGKCFCFKIYCQSCFT